jgi:hypothetical protein
MRKKESLIKNITGRKGMEILRGVRRKKAWLSLVINRFDTPEM